MDYGILTIHSLFAVRIAVPGSNVQLLLRIPEVFFECYNAVVLYLHAFFLQEFLHPVHLTKMVLSGKNHFGELNRMQKLLEKEGVKVKDDCIVAFEKHFWDPEKELDI